MRVSKLSIRLAFLSPEKIRSLRPKVVLAPNEKRRHGVDRRDDGQLPQWTPKGLTSLMARVIATRQGRIASRIAEGSRTRSGRLWKGMGDGSGCHCGCRPPTLWGSSRLGGAVMGALCVAPAYRRRETGWGGRHRPSKPRLYASETFLVLDRSSLSSGSWAPPAHEPPGRSRHCEVAGPTLVEPRHTAAPCA